MEACERVTRETDIYNMKKIREWSEEPEVERSVRDQKGERHVVTERLLFSQSPRREIYTKVLRRKIGADGANTHKEKKRQQRRGGLLGERKRRRVLLLLCLVRPTGMNCLQGA